MAEASGLQPDLRADLERVLRRIAEAGKMPASGLRELTIRVGERGEIQWLTVSRWRMSATELAAGFDETTGARAADQDGPS